MLLQHIYCVRMNVVHNTAVYCFNVFIVRIFREQEKEAILRIIDLLCIPSHKSKTNA